MSAEQDPKIGNWYVSPLLMGDPVIMAVIEAEFDASVVADNLRMQETKRANKILRNIGLIRTVSFISDMLMIAILFPPEFLKRRWALQKDIFRYLFKKITYKQMIESIKRNG